MIKTSFGKSICVAAIYGTLQVVVMTSCTSDNLDSLTKNEICINSDSVISFKNDIVPIFAANCNKSGCHSGNSPEGNLNLEASKAYAQLSRKGSGYIDTLNPKRTVLYSSLVSTSNPMPPDGKLDACTLALIENWMKQGAKDN